MPAHALNWQTEKYVHLLQENSASFLWFKRTVLSSDAFISNVFLFLLLPWFCISNSMFTFLASDLKMVNFAIVICMYIRISSQKYISFIWKFSRFIFLWNEFLPLYSHTVLHFDHIFSMSCVTSFISLTRWSQCLYTSQ